MGTELRDAMRASRLHATLSLSDACLRCWLLHPGLLACAGGKSHWLDCFA